MDLIILVYLQIERNLAGENDVTFDVKFCGVCHSGKPEINKYLIFINYSLLFNTYIQANLY